SNKNDIHTEFVKTENLKNVKEPVKIYRIKFDGSPPVRQRPLKSINRKNFVLIFLGIAVMTLIGYFVFQSSKKTNVTATNNEIVDRSIAVLPFVNMSNDKEQEYFSDGLSEELLNLLAKTPELKVIGRTSSFSFKGKNEDLRSIAQKLGVAHILEGSVRKDGNKIRVTAQLIKASDGSHSWSETYEENMKGLFKLQDKIAGAVVKQLKVKLLSSSSGGSISSNIEVHNLILQGNYFFDKLDKDNVAKAVELYHRALAIDSNDARAWGKLANAVSRQSWQNYIDQNTGYEKARQAALKAVSLDNNYATGYLELGDIKLYHDFDWKGAMDAHQMAFSLEPGNAEVINGLGDVHLPVGLLKEAEQFYKKSILLDPLKPIVHMNLGNTLTSMGRYQEAIASFKKALDVNPQFQRAHMYIGRNYLLIGKPDSALKEMEKENVEVFKAFGLVLVYHALGRKPEGDETLKEFTEKYQNNWSYLLAQLHAFRGEKDEAFGWLETAYNKKDSWLFWVKGDPLLKNLKTDPRYNAFLKKMNLNPD
ncbi:MAG TPA: tetratricopeptide repeat protein, partial [Chitinophagaceae bacterium]|nr:tetratricopeptide repeat protein [Chitinophagaceae bacterium]